VAQPLTNPRELLAERLRRALWIELELARNVLPKLIEQARATDLEYAFERHLLETREHVQTLRDVLDDLQVPADPEESPALRGLVKAHERLLKRVSGEGHLLSDLAHAEAAAATEHLEIAAYHALVSLAEALGEEEVGIRLRGVMEQEELALELVDRAQTKLLAEKVWGERVLRTRSLG
jgi:ferritin-like metal-binding protein YciE